MRLRSALLSLDRHWFGGVPATRLAAFRVLLAGFSLFYLGKRVRMFVKVARTDPKLFKPVGVATPLRKPLPVPVVKATIAATLAANVAFAAGYKHRATGPLYSGLLLWTLSYRNSWSMIYHSDNLLVFHALVLGFSPSADALSLDSRRRIPAGLRTSTRSLIAGDRPPDWRYGWPLQLINAVTAASYFLAGVAKVKGPLGWKWADGDSLRKQVAVDGLRKELLGNEGAAPLAYRLYDRVGLLRVLAAGSLAVELLAPVMFPSRRLSKLWAIGALGMHWGILGIMRIKFRYQLSGIAFAPYFDLDRPVAGLIQLARHIKR